MLKKSISSIHGVKMEPIEVSMEIMGIYSQSIIFELRAFNSTEQGCKVPWPLAKNLTSQGKGLKVP